MRLIKTLSENIEDEIKGTEDYAKLAIEVRAEHPAMADVLFSIARQESEHVVRLHDQVEKLIQEYRAKHGEPPAGMLVLYEYLHEKHINDYAGAKRYLDMYQGK